MTLTADRLPSITVISVAHDVADARLHRLCRSLDDAGFDVRVIGLGRVDQSPYSSTTIVMERVGGLRRVALALRLPWTARSDAIVVIDPDLIPAALLARRLRRSRFLVCDIHENYRQVVDDRQWASPITRWLARRGASVLHRLAAAADMTIVADDHVPPLSARRRRVVTNRPVLLPTGPTRPHPPFRAVYVGDVRESRGLTTMLDAIESAPDWELDIVGPVNIVADRARLEQRLSDLHRVRWWGRLQPHEARDVVTQAHVGMALLEETPAFAQSMPTKVYEYLNAGLAVLTSPIPRPASLVAGSGTGAVVDGAVAAAEQLASWSRDPGLLTDMGERARAWSRDHLDLRDEFVPVAAEIASAASPRPDR